MMVTEGIKETFLKEQQKVENLYIKLIQAFDQFFIKMKDEETNLLNAYENLKENRL